MTGMWLVAIFLTTSVRVTDAGSGNEWGYEGNTGPSTWHIDYPQCSGKSQSPISVDTSKAVLNTNLTSFDLQGYDTASNVNMSLKNNGHSVQVDLTGNTMFVRGGGLPNSFRAKQFHFHWGSEDKRGSEHDINGRHFPMEMHVVHYNTKYSSYNEASNKTNGLLVLAFLFEVGTANANFEHIIRHFYQIAHKEWSFGVKKLVKTYLQSTIHQERLWSLALLHVHRDVPIGLDEILNEFIGAKNSK